MSQFLFLYRGGSQPESPDEGQKVMQKWVSWMEGLAKDGHMVDRGQPLEPGGKVVRGSEKTITDGPYAETKDLVGGFTVIDANDLSKAAELAKGCPIFERGGLVEVRPIMQM